MSSCKHQRNTQSGNQWKVEEDNPDSHDQEEASKLVLMRSFVESSDPSSKEVDDLTMRRFLRARDLNVENGGQLLLKYLKWRREFIPNGFISESEIPNELAQMKMFMQGHDRKGCPIFVLLGRNHFQNKQPSGLDELKRLVVYSLDKLSSRVPIGEEKFIGIVDLKGWGYSNSDIRGYLAAASVLQDYYPERLKRGYLLNVPRIFMAVWKIIYRFLDNRTREKIVIVENRLLKETLLGDIDESQIPQIYGGKLELVPIDKS